MKELGCTGDVSVCKCSGITECKKALTLMKVGRLPEDFVEGMVCEGGCVGGPSRHRDPNLAMRDRNAALAKSSDILIKDNLDKQNAESVDMIR